MISPPPRLNKANIVCTHSFLCGQATVPDEERGVSTHAPSQARECLHRNAFGTPDGACFLRYPVSYEFRVS
jgi:hypothetical protein